MAVTTHTTDPKQQAKAPKPMPNKKLLKLAAKHRPPQSWYEERDFAAQADHKPVLESPSTSEKGTVHPMAKPYRSGEIRIRSVVVSRRDDAAVVRRIILSKPDKDRLCTGVSHLAAPVPSPQTSSADTAPPSSER